MSAGAGMLRISKLLGSLIANGNCRALPLPGGFWHHRIQWLVGFRLRHVKSVALSVTFHCCVVYLFCYLFSIIVK